MEDNKEILKELVFRLGLKAKDKITGYEGIIVGFCKYLYGCNQYGLNPGKGSDGKLLDVVWFDEGRIVVTGDGIHEEEVRVEKNGAGGINKECPGKGN